MTLKMTIDQFITLLAALTSIGMMVTLGLKVKASDIFEVGKRPDLLFRVLVANYILVPGAAFGLLLLCRASPMVAAGFVVVAVCPGAFYALPFTPMTKSNVTVPFGLIVLLAASSALLAPFLLALLLPLIAGKMAMAVNVFKMMAILLGVQVLPLLLGFWIRHRYAALAARLKRPASIFDIGLNLVLLTVIIVVQFHTLANIEERGFIGLLCLVLATLVVGKLVVKHSRGAAARAMLLGISVRNVGISLVIASGSLPGTAAISSVTAYGICQTILITLFAFSWGRRSPVVRFVGQGGLP